MPYQLTVMYHQPEDPTVFDAHYEETHAGLARQLPGLTSYSSTKADPDPRGRPARFYLVAMLQFADGASFDAAMSSAHGSVVQQDVATFASGGVTILSGDVTTYL